MKTFFAFAATLLAFSLIAVPVAEAKRLGGGSNLGKQYSTPHSAPAQQAKPAGAAAPASAAAASAAPRASGASRWLGPLAGLAAGGLLASLFFGDGFQGMQVMDFLMIALVIFGGIMLFRFMRRGASPLPAGSGAGTGLGSSPLGGDIRARTAPTSSPATGFTASAKADENQTPAWFNAKNFADGARSHFLRLQAAWDKADFNDIREYTTPELFEELKRERLALGTEPQVTEPMTLNVQLAGVRRDGDLVVVSLEFSGLIREAATGEGNRFQEIWHIQHAWKTAEGDWFIAGIQQVG
ncbi:MAG: TIM44-like domain-containing protein [Chromatiaceae bacterium]|nr:TIM44-like domain-containing protein [Chromatiaceae bacterium]